MAYVNAATARLRKLAADPDFGLLRLELRREIVQYLRDIGDDIPMPGEAGISDPATHVEGSTTPEKQSWLGRLLTPA